jgi:heme/copper-type cytochrome/quinol oxidase subunit 2
MGLPPDPLFSFNSLIPFMFDVFVFEHEQDRAMYFQTPASPIMEGIIDLHHDIMFFLCFIIGFVLFLLTVTIIQFFDEHIELYDDIHGYPGDEVTHNTCIEII